MTMTSGDPTAVLHRTEQVQVLETFTASAGGQHRRLERMTRRAATKAARRTFGNDFELFRETPIGFERVLP